MKRYRRLIPAFLFSAMAVALISCGPKGNNDSTTSADASSALVCGAGQVASDGTCYDQFRVSFLNDDGTSLATLQVISGGYAAYTGVTPTKKASQEFRYTFDGWDKDPATTKIVADTTFTAKYTSVKNKYKLVFFNGTTTLQSENLDYGSEVAYKGATPTRESADPRKPYQFSGWDTTGDGAADVLPTTLVADLSCYAAYTEGQAFKVTFLDQDGTTVIGTPSYLLKNSYATAPSEHGNPPSADKVWLDYQFKGWDKDPTTTSITADTTFKAVWEGKTKQAYTVKITSRGATIYEASFEYHDAAYKANDFALPVWEGVNEGESPDLSAKHYAHHYAGLDVNADGVSDTLDLMPADGMIEADFTAAVLWNTVEQYHYVYQNGDGSLMADSLGNHHFYADFGKAPDAYPADTPTKAATAEQTFEFLSWSPSNIASYAADTIFAPTWMATGTLYPVTFLDHNDAVVNHTTQWGYGTTGDVYLNDNLGTPVTAENYYNLPTHEGYTFAGWSLTKTSPTLITDWTDASLTLQGALTFYAVYTKGSAYQITYYDGDGVSVLGTTVTLTETLGSYRPSTDPSAKLSDGLGRYAWSGGYVLTKDDYSLSDAVNDDTEVTSDLSVYPLYSLTPLPIRLFSAAGVYFQTMSDGSMYVWGTPTTDLVGATTGVTSLSQTSVTKYVDNYGPKEGYAKIVGNNHVIIALGKDGNLYSRGAQGYYVQGSSTLASGLDTHFTKLAVAKFGTVGYYTVLDVAVGGTDANPCFVAAVKNKSSGNVMIWTWGNPSDEYQWGNPGYASVGGTNNHNPVYMAKPNSSTDTLWNVAEGFTSTPTVSLTCSLAATYVLVKANGGDSGTLYSCGSNLANEGGSGHGYNAGYTKAPTPILADSSSFSCASVAVVGAEGTSVIALGNSSTLYGWGVNGDKQLGNNATTSVGSPTLISQNTSIASIASASRDTTYHVLFLTISNMTLYGYGYQNGGALGNGKDSSTIAGSFAAPISASAANTLLPAGGSYLSVLSGANATLFDTSDGKLYGCGLNASHQLGDGTTTTQATPILIKDFMA